MDLTNGATTGFTVSSWLPVAIVPYPRYHSAARPVMLIVIV